MSLRKKIVLGAFIGFAIFLGYRGYKVATSTDSDETSLSLHKNEILHLEINGVIMNGKKFLSNLKKYAGEDAVKAIVIEINSPGGAVGPSQELFMEIKRAKEEHNKPVICVSTGLIASGGYYAAMACDQIIVAPGTMIGSIGVIMEFANLEDLYSWAKVKRYTIKSGKFKDSGSEFRAMRDDERKLFQDMIDEVYSQFRNTVAESRKLDVSFVTQYADGRVMTGAKAVELKFADGIGTFEDAVRIAADKVGLKKDDYHVLRPHRGRPTFMSLFTDNDDDDDLNSITKADLKAVLKGEMSGQAVEQALKTVFKTQTLNQPMMIMPGYWE
ncbi:signal peptide peptidase SppA [Bdellovibrio sp. qaytius]|nr:signal peptide peptidase SppA [Bdellovibrio sp. qaytius]